MESAEHLTYRREGATATVTMNRPEGPEAFAEKWPAHFTRR